MGFPVGAGVTVEELRLDPHPLLARLRAAEPVSWVPALGGWLVTRHDLARRVMRDAEAFTVDDPRFSTARVLGTSMLSLDGPEHARHRDAFAGRFRPSGTRARFTAFVEQEVHRLIADVAARGRMEVRADLAGPLAAAVVTEALGLRDVTPADVRSWYDAFVTAVSALTAGRAADATDAYARLRATVEAALEEAAAKRASRPASSTDDGAGAPAPLLAAAARDLTTVEVVADAAVVMFGGIETTEGMIANAVAHLLGDPDQLGLVLADPALVTAAVEESVRLEPAASVVDRYAVDDVTLGEARIGRGDLVRVSLAAANRDPAVFTDPDRYDVRRPDVDRHLSFARGPHFCFGAHLARLEAVTALRALLDLPGVRLVEAGRLEGLVFRRPPVVRVSWDVGSITPTAFTL